jgi:CBS domain containing-hemolysin-like protein
MTEGTVWRGRGPLGGARRSDYIGGDDMVLNAIAAVVLVFLNGFFVAAEFALTRVRPTQARELERARRAGASSVQHGVEHIDAYLAACQLGITLASIALGVIGKPAFESLLQPVFGGAASAIGTAVSAALAFVLITLLHVVVGELAAKSLAIARTTSTALLVAPWLRAFYVVTKPVVDLLNGMGNLLLRPFGIPSARESGHAPHTERELRSLLAESRALGLIEPGEHRIAERGFAFADRRVREVMHPRGDIKFVTTDDSVRDAARRAIRVGHTRLPVCAPDQGLDAPLGLIHAQDLLEATLERPDVALHELIRPLIRVSEATLIGILLAQMRRQRRHMALVADEHGTTVGLVTLEDLLEELVGEIDDEFDLEPSRPIVREAEQLTVAGSMPIHELEVELGTELRDTHGDTVGGHVIELFGRLPDVGERIDLDGHQVEVIELGDATIQTLRIRIKNVPDVEQR